MITKRTSKQTSNFFFDALKDSTSTVTITVFNGENGEEVSALVANGNDLADLFIAAAQKARSNTRLNLFQISIENTTLVPTK